VDERDGTGGDGAAGEAPVERRRRWWQTVPVLALLGVVAPPFGLFFLGFVAIALLLSDVTRETEVRAGGAVLLFWWAYSFREGDTTPYFGMVLLAIGATLFARVAVTRLRAGRRDAGLPGAVALLAVALGVVSFVPYGYREATVTRDEAARRVFAERAAHPWRRIDASSYLVDRGRLRVVHKPVWYVAVYERNPTVELTVDKQPCFSRREVWRVDALDGSVTRATYDEARAGGDPCLPLRAGTKDDLRPAPTAAPAP
jgi:hypothetical protein